jgi:hypothetical protein
MCSSTAAPPCLIWVCDWITCNYSVMEIKKTFVSVFERNELRYQSTSRGETITTSMNRNIGPPGWKIQRLWPGLNPRTRVPVASMLTTRPPKPSCLAVCACPHEVVCITPNLYNVCICCIRSERLYHLHINICCTITCNKRYKVSCIYISTKYKHWHLFIFFHVCSKIHFY